AAAPSSAFSSTIQGTALTSVNQPMPGAIVRLRDARNGRIVDTQVTDKSGHFVFRDVDPGSYVVEIVSQDRTSTLAASACVQVGGGDRISRRVSMLPRLAPWGGLVGPMPPPAAAAIAAGAAATAVLVVAAPGALGGPTCPLK